MQIFNADVRSILRKRTMFEKFSNDANTTEWQYLLQLIIRCFLRKKRNDDLQTNNAKRVVSLRTKVRVLFLTAWIDAGVYRAKGFALRLEFASFFNPFVVGEAWLTQHLVGC